MRKELRELVDIRSFLALHIFISLSRLRSGAILRHQTDRSLQGFCQSREEKLYSFSLLYNTYWLLAILRERRLSYDVVREAQF